MTNFGKFQCPNHTERQKHTTVIVSGRSRFGLSPANLLRCARCRTPLKMILNWTEPEENKDSGN